jgi:uncharacterized membrane protein
MQALLITVHIFAAAIWMGAGIYAGFSYPRHAANGTLRGVMTVDQKLGSIVFGIAIVLVLLSGIGLVMVSDVFGFGHAFVLVGIGVIVVTSIAEGVVFGPATKRTAEAEAAGSTKIDPVFRWAPLIYIALFGFTIWAMVTKLGV